MPGPYATLGDLRKHWAGMPVEKEEEATQKLLEAAIHIRGLFPALDSKIADGLISHDVPMLVSCRMVKRALEPSEDVPEMFAGMDQVNFATGAFSVGGRMRNPDGSLYLTADDKRLLSGPRRRPPFSVFPGGC